MKQSFTYPYYHIYRPYMLLRYRPDRDLKKLRNQLSNGDCAVAAQSSPSYPAASTLLLPWLRTLFVECRDVVPNCRREHVEAFLKRRCNHHCRRNLPPNVIVEAVVLQELSSYEDILCFLKTAMRLTSLDLRSCWTDKPNSTFFIELAAANPFLKRLFLDPKSNCPATVLEQFTVLEMLDATSYGELTNVHFCAQTLTVLIADHCAKLTDAGLANAVHLEVLCVAGCRRVTTLAPFGQSLRDLDASFHCGIHSEALSQCLRLQRLAIYDNPSMTSIPSHFGRFLRELDVSGFLSVIGDAALAHVTSLVKFACLHNHHVCTVTPFANSLLELTAGNSKVDDAGLALAQNLTNLDACDHPLITNLAPFAGSLLALRAEGERSGLTDAVLQQQPLPQLMFMNCSRNRHITSLSSCGSTLRHLQAHGDPTALGDTGLTTVTKLVTLECSWNRHIRTIAPFVDSLQELTVCDTAGSIYLLEMVQQLVDNLLREAAHTKKNKTQGCRQPSKFALHTVDSFRQLSSRESEILKNLGFQNIEARRWVRYSV